MSVVESAAFVRDTCAVASSTPGPQGDVRRPLRDGVDGDDVWPPLTASELEAIASVDRAIGQQERDSDGWKPEVMARLLGRFGGVAIYSFAERVRHYRDLVDDLEQGVAPDHELLSELWCRTVVERLLGQVPENLRSRLQAELIGPLDHRFTAATIDDGGAYLHGEFGDQVGTEGWWWAHRPSYFTDAP